MGVAADRWRTALGEWAIPVDILAAAPADPYTYSTQLFRSGGDQAEDTPSMRAARSALGDGGTVLDVGCGGGRSSLPLGGAMTRLTGVDPSEPMLAQFRRSARGVVAADTVLGRWPDVAGRVPHADVVVCHHVVYNVADIVAFVRILSEHARTAVVVELTNAHPQAPLNGLWREFWGIERPTQPTAALFVDVVRELGFDPTVTPFRRGRRSAPLATDELIAHVRQRICLPASRDPEIAAALGPDPQLTADELVTVTWSIRPGPGR